MVLYIATKVIKIHIQSESRIYSQPAREGQHKIPTFQRDEFERTGFSNERHDSERR